MTLLSAVRAVTEITIAASIVLNVVSIRINRRTLRIQKNLADGIASLMGDAYRQGVEESAHRVATLAERPYDNEPEFSAMIRAEHDIRELIKR